MCCQYGCGATPPTPLCAVEHWRQPGAVCSRSPPSPAMDRVTRAGARSSRLVRKRCDAYRQKHPNDSRDRARCQIRKHGGDNLYISATIVLARPAGNRHHPRIDLDEQLLDLNLEGLDLRLELGSFVGRHGAGNDGAGHTAGAAESYRARGLHASSRELPSRIVAGHHGARGTQPGQSRWPFHVPWACFSPCRERTKT